MTSYASLAQFMDAVGLDDESDDASVQRALDAATDWINGYTGRVFGAVGTSTIRYFDALETGRLATTDLVTVTQVAIDTAQDGTFTTILPTTDYQLYPLTVGQPGYRGNYREIRIRPLSSHAFWPGYQVKVTGTWGYGSVPASVEEACILIANRYFRRAAAPFGIISAPESGEFARLPNNDPDVTRLLSGYTVSGRSSSWVVV